MEYPCSCAGFHEFAICQAVKRYVHLNQASGTKKRKDTSLNDLKSATRKQPRVEHNYKIFFLFILVFKLPGISKVDRKPIAKYGLFELCIPVENRK